MRTSLLLFLIMLSQIVEAQVSRSLKGSITDETNGHPLPYATIAVYNNLEEFLSGTSTNQSGKFELSLPSNADSIEISFIGFNKIRYSVTQVEKMNWILNVSLPVSITHLKDVTISGDKTVTELYLDRKVINFGKDLQNSGSNALMAFSQLPEITVDPSSGMISFRGDQNVKILVNGKPSPLNNNDLLRQILSNQIERVELITSPSAKYQADGHTGLINIILKENKMKGKHASLSTGIGSYNQYEGNLNLNIGTNKINYRMNLGHESQNFNGSNLITRTFKDHSELSHGTNDFAGRVTNISTGLDWFITEKDELSVQFKHTNNSHEMTGISSFKNVDSFEVSNTQVNSAHAHLSDEYNLNYRKKIKGNDHYLEAELNINNNRNDLPASLFRDENLDVDNQIAFSNSIANFSLDYARTLPLKMRLESGMLITSKSIRSSQTITFSDNISDQSEFLYDEVIAAGYVLLNQKFNKITWQTGIRTEQFNSNGRGSEGRYEIERNFFNLFPSAHVAYQLNKQNALSFGYSKRISRPSFHHLNPITTFGSTIMKHEGTPALLPEFGNNFDLTWQSTEDKATFSSSIFYRYKTNLINHTFTLDDNDMTVVNYSNNGLSHGYGIEVQGNMEMNKFWQIDISGNYYGEKLEGLPDIIVFNTLSAYTALLKNSFKISNNITLDITYRYQGKRIKNNFIMRSQQRFSVSAQMKILKAKGTLSLRFNDVFYQDFSRIHREGFDYTEDVKWLHPTRMSFLVFTYNLLNENNFTKRTRKKRSYSEMGVSE